MRASRLVSLLLLLQTRHQMTAAELAVELEVSERTIHRDVEALSEAGVPIFAARGPHGGIRLVDGYRTRLTGMTPDEAQALFLSGLPGPAAELGLGTVMAAARLKVLAALPPELRARASRLVERFHLDAAGWFHAAEPAPYLAVLSEAVWEAARVEVEYTRPDRQVTRTLEPLGLVIKGGVWYLVARSDDQVRTYRVSRVTGARLLDERFERPDSFDLAAYWAESSAAYEREVPRIAVTVRLPADRLDRLAGRIGDRAMERAERLDIDDPEGWQHLVLQLDWPDEAPEILLGMGADLEVLDPADVRERIVSVASDVARRYGGSGGSAVPRPASGSVSVPPPPTELH